MNKSHDSFAGNQGLDLARPLLPITSASTESNLMVASSSVFCTRSTWLDCSRTNCLRVRRRLRLSWVCAFGTKLARDRAPAVRPDGIVDVGLAHILLVRGVCQHQLKFAIIQDVPHRLPVDAGRLHSHMRATVDRQPLRSAQKVCRSRLESTNFRRYLAIGYKAQAGRHRLFVNVKTTTASMQQLHLPSPLSALHRRRVGLGPVENLTERTCAHI
jgi:hypothetical protein